MHEEDEILWQSRRFQVVRKTVEAGGEVHVRNIIRHPGAVVMLPVLDDGRIVLIRNYRVTANESLVELPAGTLDPGEEPLAAAHRELAEETGYRAGAMELLSTFYSSPGMLDERMWLYRATQLTPGRTNLDHGEQIEPLPLPLDEALAMARDGRIQDAKTLVGLLWAAVFGWAAGT